LPGLLWTLARNRHHSLPQSVFEIGEVTFLDPATDTGARERLHAAFAAVAPKIGFAEVRAFAETVTRELGWPFRRPRPVVS
jgi:phenylalanyl-tRNA synthetase beta chain